MDRYSLLILNGPNLSTITRSELRAFSTNWLDEVEELCREQAIDLDISIDFRQSNNEGELVEWIHQSTQSFNGIVINPSSYGYTSWAIHDALNLVQLPVVEVNLSNTAKVGSKDQATVTARAADIVIAGAGEYGYLLAMDALVQLLDKDKKLKI